MENVLIEYKDIKLVELSNSHKMLLLSWLTDSRVLDFWEGEKEVFDLARIESDFYSVEVFDITRAIIKFNGQEIGYIQMYTLTDEMKVEYKYSGSEKCGAIDCFVGVPELWGKGIGSKFLVLAKEFLFKKGVESIIIDPHCDNLRAIKCYEKVGFSKVKLLPKHELHNGKYVDCYLMICKL